MEQIPLLVKIALMFLAAYLAFRITASLLGFVVRVCIAAALLVICAYFLGVLPVGLSGPSA